MGKMESAERFRYPRISRHDSFAPRSYRSGKNCRGLGVPDRGIAAVDADVGVGLDGARNGVLRGKHVRGAWTRNDELAREKRRDEERDRVRAFAKHGNGMQHVFLPRGRRLPGE